MTSVTDRVVATTRTSPFGLMALLLADSDAAAAADVAAPPLRTDYADSPGRVSRAEGRTRTGRLRLTDILDLGPDSFVLEFTPLGGPRLRDGSYVLRRRGVRPHALLLAAGGDGTTLRAVI